MEILSFFFTSKWSINKKKRDIIFFLLIRILLSSKYYFENISKWMKHILSITVEYIINKYLSIVKSIFRFKREWINKYEL